MLLNSRVCSCNPLSFELSSYWHANLLYVDIKIVWLLSINATTDVAFCFLLTHFHHDYESAALFEKCPPPRVNWRKC